ncbi:MAG: hypothetical protein R2867_26295 [Caldilineaceae bacterium]
MENGQQGGIVEITDSGSYDFNPTVEITTLTNRHLVARRGGGGVSPC